VDKGELIIARPGMVKMVLW